MALLIYFSYSKTPVVEEAEGIEVASLALPLEAAAADSVCAVLGCLEMASYFFTGTRNPFSRH